MSAFVFRVAALGPNWVIRSANDQVIYGYAEREKACRAAELAAMQLREQGIEACVVIDEPPSAGVAA